MDDVWCAGVLAMHQPWYSKPSMQILRRRRLCGGITGLEWLNPSVGILQMEEVVSLDSYDAYGGFGVVGSALEFLFFPTHLRRSGEGSVHRCDMSCQMLQGDAKGSWSHAPVS